MQGKNFWRKDVCKYYWLAACINMKYSIEPAPQTSKPEAKNNNTELKKTPSSASQDSQRSDRRRESSSSARSVSSPNASRRSPKSSRESPQLPPGICSDFSFIYIMYWYNIVKLVVWPMQEDLPTRPLNDQKLNYYIGNSRLTLFATIVKDCPQRNCEMK